MVTLAAPISKEGDVINVLPISGDSELIKISVDAVEPWKYTPYILNGEPLEGGNADPDQLQACGS